MPRVSKEKRQFFMEAYTAHGDAIFRHCYFRLFKRERAKEIMQDTFMRTWGQITKGINILNIKAFLYRIATNLIIDETRKKKTESLDLLQEKGFNPSFTTIESIFITIDAQMVTEVISRIDSKYRDVIIMRYLDDLSVKEIAAVLDISQNATSVRIHRGLKEVKKILAYEHKL